MAAADKTIDSRILAYAREEFLSKPYKNVSLREICARAGVTTGALYNRYPNKAALFDALVEPVLERIAAYSGTVEAFSYDRLDKNDMKHVWSVTSKMQARIVDLLYDHYEGFRLLLCRAEGTRHADFIHEFTARMTERSMAFIEEVRRRGYNARAIDKLELHMLLTAYWSTMFEPVIHGLSREKALEHSELVARLFDWTAVLGF